MRVTAARVEWWSCVACASAEAGGPWLGKIAEGMTRPRRRNGKCPHCGSTQESARETGLVGCPLCYVAFEDAFWREIGLIAGAWSPGA